MAYGRVYIYSWDIYNNIDEENAILILMFSNINITIMYMCVTDRLIGIFVRVNIWYIYRT